MIETFVHGDPAACHSLASSLSAYENALDATIDTLTAARNDADGVGEWVGDQLVDTAGDVGEFLGDAASDAGDAIGRAWDGLWD